MLGFSEHLGNGVWLHFGLLNGWPVASCTGPAPWPIDWPSFPRA